jgi:hypothetical protein
MLDKLIGALIGFAICKFLAGGSDVLSNLFHVSYKTRPGQSGPSPSPALTTTAVSFPVKDPGGLPPWPTGWKPMAPLPSSVVQRAVALLPVMAVNEKKVEQGPDGGWVTYYKSKQGTKTGVTAWMPKPGALTATTPVAA